MTLPVVLAPEAEGDLDRATVWYDAQQPDLGAVFLRSVEACLERIQRRPLSYPIDEIGVRSALLHRFPYAIRFRVGEKRIEIIAVWHGRRDPAGWRERLRRDA